MHLYREFSDAIFYNRLIELESSVFFKLIFFLKLYVFGLCVDISFVDSTMIQVYILRRYANKIFKGITIEHTKLQVLFSTYPELTYISIQLARLRFIKQGYSCSNRILSFLDNILSSFLLMRHYFCRN